MLNLNSKYTHDCNLLYTSCVEHHPTAVKGSVNSWQKVFLRMLEVCIRMTLRQTERGNNHWRWAVPSRAGTITMGLSFAAGLHPCSGCLHIRGKHRVLWKLMRETTDPGLKGQEKPKGTCFQVEAWWTSSSARGRWSFPGREKHHSKGFLTRQLAPEILLILRSSS